MYKDCFVFIYPQGCSQHFVKLEARVVADRLLKATMAKSLFS